jgi:hypothetical protein
MSTGTPANPLDRTQEHIDKARPVVPDGYQGELAVGWKITHTDGTTGRDASTRPVYFWGLVGPHQPAVLHVADNWDDDHGGSCPSRPGDGLCVATHIRNVTSGGVALSNCIGHVLVYPADLARSNEAGKLRSPWVVQVESFDVLHVLRFCANLRGADLCGADLRGADLCGVDLCDADLRGANLRGADLCDVDLCDVDLRDADLCDANLRDANLRGAHANQYTLWPHGFDHATAGVVVR